MSVMLSTGLRNKLLSGTSLRKVFEDGVINVYSGTAPASADSPATGTLLVPITKASGAVASGVSVAKEARVLINDHGAGSTYVITVNGIVYTYVNTPDAGSAALVAQALAALVYKDAEVVAHCAGTATIYVVSRIAGLDFTISVGGTGSSTLTDNAISTVTRNTLKFGDAALGVLSKTADVWSGVAIAGGTAGYFRLVQLGDDALLSTREPRLQGNVSTSGQEMTLSSTTIALGATQTIDTVSITQPAS